MKIYGLNIEKIKNMDFSWVKEDMPLRYEKAMKYRIDEDRLRSFGVALLLREIVGVKSEKDIIIEPNGKPVAKGYKCFNVSHSGAYSTLVVSDDPVGVDIEQISGSNLYLANSIYTKDELEWMNEDALKRFHVLWTLKESVMKATGLGFALEMSNFSAIPLINNEGIMVEEKRWFSNFDSNEEYAYSICMRKPIERIEWVEYS